MNIKLRLSVTMFGALLSTACLAYPGEQIKLDNLSMVSPGHEKSISLSKLSDKKFYTIEAVLQNTNFQDVDYKISTYYATNEHGSMGGVITSTGPLIKDGNGYKGHLTSADQYIKITLYNVKPDHGIVLNDHVSLENLTPTNIGSGIELRNVVATEQADSGAGLNPLIPLSTG